MKYATLASCPNAVCLIGSLRLHVGWEPRAAPGFLLVAVKGDSSVGIVDSKTNQKVGGGRRRVV